MSKRVRPENAGSEPRVDPKTNSCGLCGELLKDCDGHLEELPGMEPTKRKWGGYK